MMIRTFLLLPGEGQDEGIRKLNRQHFKIPHFSPLPEGEGVMWDSSALMLEQIPQLDGETG
jgi:hypothetical protein